MKRKLTDQQQKFADEYIKTLNATDAYKLAGYKAKSEKAAGASASRLLGNVRVKAYLHQQMQKHEIDEFMTESQILQHYADIVNGKSVTETYESYDLSHKKPKLMTKSKKTYTPQLGLQMMALDSLVRYRQMLNSDTELNEAKTAQAKAQARKLEAEADVARFKADILTGKGNDTERTVILDDLEDEENETSDKDK